MLALRDVCEFNVVQQVVQIPKSLSADYNSGSA